MIKQDKKRKIFDWILNILLIILIIVGIYLFLSRIFGYSPSDFQLILWLFGFFGTAMVKMFSLVYNINREVGELKIGVKNSFDKIKKDINIIKLEIYDIKKLFKAKIK